MDYHALKVQIAEKRKAYSKHLGVEDRLTYLQELQALLYQYEITTFERQLDFPHGIPEKTDRFSVNDQEFTVTFLLYESYNYFVQKWNAECFQRFVDVGWTGTFHGMTAQHYVTNYTCGLHEAKHRAESRILAIRDGFYGALEKLETLSGKWAEGLDIPTGLR